MESSSIVLVQLQETFSFHKSLVSLSESPEVVEKGTFLRIGVVRSHFLVQFELLYFKRIAILKVNTEVDHIAVRCSCLIVK